MGILPMSITGARAHATKCIIVVTDRRLHFVGGSDIVLRVARVSRPGRHGQDARAT
jgi:hypothetical protein